MRIIAELSLFHSLDFILMDITVYIYIYTATLLKILNNVTVCTLLDL